MTIDLTSDCIHENREFTAHMLVDGKPKSFTIVKREWIAGQPKKSDREYNLKVTRIMAVEIGGVTIRDREHELVPMDAQDIVHAFSIAPEVERLWIEQQKAAMRVKMMSVPQGFDAKKLG